MRFIVIAALITSFAGLAASDAAAGEVKAKAGYCKVAAGCTPVSNPQVQTPCCCTPSNRSEEGIEHGRAVQCGTPKALELGLVPCPSDS